RHGRGRHRGHGDRLGQGDARSDRHRKRPCPARHRRHAHAGRADRRRDFRRQPEDRHFPGRPAGRPRIVLPPAPNGCGCPSRRQCGPLPPAGAGRIEWWPEAFRSSYSPRPRNAVPVRRPPRMMPPKSSPDHSQSRRPGAFSVDDEGERAMPVARRSPRSFEDNVVVTPDDLDPFVTPPELAAAMPVAEPRRRRRFSFANLALAAFGTFLSLAFGLWADSVIRDLFTRADWLGYAALTALAIGLLAVTVVVGREILGLMRLAAVQSLKADAEEAVAAAFPAAARSVVASLSRILSH